MYPQFRKAAILVDSLDRPTADRLLAQLPPDDVERIWSTVRVLGPIDPIERQEVLEEFRRNQGPTDDPETDGVELAGSLTQSEPAGSLSAQNTSAGDRASDLFQSLKPCHAAELTKLLCHEHPQTIALVISRMPREQASEVLFGLEKKLQAEVVRRLLDLDQANPAAAEAVTRNLETRLHSQIQDRERRTAGLTTVRQILRAAGPLAEQELRNNLETHDAELANLVAEPGKRPKRKTAPQPATLDFDRLAEFSDADLLSVVRACEPACLPLALAGATPRFATRVLKLLPKRESRSLSRAIDHIGALPLRDIERAQQAVARVASRRAAAQGQTSVELVLSEV